MVLLLVNKVKKNYLYNHICQRTNSVAQLSTGRDASGGVAFVSNSGSAGAAMPKSKIARTRYSIV